MAITSPLPGLVRYRHAINAVLAIESRQLDELTPEEVALESQWQRSLEPVLSDLYWHPLRSGLEQAPENAADLRRWLQERLSDTAATAALLALMNRYLVQSFNLGGALALQMLGLSAGFNLTDTDILDEIETHAEELATVGTNLSLVDTTVDDLVGFIPLAREDAGNTILILSALIAGRALLRSSRIAATEQARGTGWGMHRTYGRNGVAQMQFMTRADDRVCELCGPRHGVVVRVNSIPADMVIPLHVECRCYWLAVMQGWTPPATVWRG